MHVKRMQRFIMPGNSTIEYPRLKISLEIKNIIINVQTKHVHDWNLGLNGQRTNFVLSKSEIYMTYYISFNRIINPWLMLRKHSSNGRQLFVSASKTLHIHLYFNCLFSKPNKLEFFSNRLLNITTIIMSHVHIFSADAFVLRSSLFLIIFF